MFKNVISPIQAWLLSQKRCVGCGRPLSLGKVVNGGNGEVKVACKCGRVYMKDTKNNKFRRALIEEV